VTWLYKSDIVNFSLFVKFLYCTGETEIVAFRDQVEYQDMPKYMDGPDANPVQGASTMEYLPPTNSKFPRYFMGNLKLPVNSMIKTQLAGDIIQAFTVVQGQMGAFEFALGMQDQPFFDRMATRYLLSPGDTFRIPPGNYFRFQNHSTTRECHLTWILIHPYSEETIVDESTSNTSPGSKHAGSEEEDQESS
jgi:centromere protein C